STGPPGSCCHIDGIGGCGDGGNLICCDGVLQSACVTPTDDYRTRSWSPLACNQRADCVPCNIPTCNNFEHPPADPLNLENEPDCYTNYVDASNRGCQNMAFGALAKYWTPVSCGQSGCGRSGSYSFVNSFSQAGQAQAILEQRRDDDAYLLNLTQDSR